MLNYLHINLSIAKRKDRAILRELKRLKRKHGKLEILAIGVAGHASFPPYLSDYGNVKVICEGIEYVDKDCEESKDIVKADISKQFPFDDGVFDIVISSDIYEHVSIAAQVNIIAETNRVLKSGGTTVNIIKTDSNSLLYAFAHRHHNLFNEYFVDRPRHYGLECPSVLKEMFRVKFLGIRCYKLSAQVWPVGACQVFNNEYAAESSLIGLILRLDQCIGAYAGVRGAVNIMLELVSRIVDTPCPLDSSDLIAVVSRRKIVDTNVIQYVGAPAGIFNIMYNVWPAVKGGLAHARG